MTLARHSVEVRLAAQRYAIAIGQGLIADPDSWKLCIGAAAHAVIVTDEHVETPYAHEAAASLQACGLAVDVLVTPPGETSKSIELAAQLWNKLLALGADRRTLVVAVGGGVVGDLAGFVAATYARGLRFIQVPTTLLAQVDSAVGGKVGINLPAAKNMVGAFWQPQAVIADIDTLASLGEREFRAGLAEVVKYGVILAADFFAWLEEHVAAINAREAGPLLELVSRCCRLKADVVEQDERETSGRRAVLNYGHTVAHALEATAGYGQFLHGEAVAIGMTAAARLACRLQLAAQEVLERQSQLLSAFGLPLALPKERDLPALLLAMQHDKKVASGRLRWVLPTQIGRVEVGIEVEPTVVADLLARD